MDRRENGDRRKERDRLTARGLPDEFAQAGGEPSDRIAGLVSRHWPERTSADREIVSTGLLPILRDLTGAGVPVTDEHRGKCEDLVVEWLNEVKF